MCGYTRILSEAARQWTSPPDIVLVQAAVGGLACAVGSWFAQQYGKWRPYLILCQPRQSQRTIMDCLSADEMSYIAWPVVTSIFDAFIKVEEHSAVEAVAALQKLGIDAGYSGACGMAAWLQLSTQSEYAPLREAASLSPSSRIMIIVTEA
jgi:diaminopropionate ammonia-lyase